MAVEPGSIILVNLSEQSCGISYFKQGSSNQLTLQFHRCLKESVSSQRFECFFCSRRNETRSCFQDFFTAVLKAINFILDGSHSFQLLMNSDIAEEMDFLDLHLSHLIVCTILVTVCVRMLDAR